MILLHFSFNLELFIFQGIALVPGFKYQFSVILAFQEGLHHSFSPVLPVCFCNAHELRSISKTSGS